LVWGLCAVYFFICNVFEPLNTTSAHFRAPHYIATTWPLLRQSYSCLRLVAVGFGRGVFARCFFFICHAFEPLKTTSAHFLAPVELHPLEGVTVGGWAGVLVWWCFSLFVMCLNRPRQTLPTCWHPTISPLHAHLFDHLILV
jgi:hypothetical protein